MALRKEPQNLVARFSSVWYRGKNRWVWGKQVQKFLTDIAQIVLFGMLVVLSLMGVQALAHQGISPFAVVSFSVTIAMFFAVGIALPKLWKSEVLSGKGFAQAFVLGAFLFLAITCMVLGIYLGAEVAVCVLLLALSLPFNLVARRIFWGESMGRFEKILISVIFVALPFLLVATGERTQELASLGGCLFLVGTILWSVVASLSRPQTLSVSFQNFWTWVSVNAALIGLPILFWLHRHMKADAVFENRSFPADFSSFGSVAVFGLTFVLFRIPWTTSSLSSNSRHALWVSVSFGILVGLAVKFGHPALEVHQWAAGFLQICLLVLLSVHVFLQNKKRDESFSSQSYQEVEGSETTESALSMLS